MRVGGSVTLRKYLFILIPLLLPTALYYLYAFLLKRKSQKKGEEELPEVPTKILWYCIGLGFVLMVITLYFLVEGENIEPPSYESPVYTPPKPKS